MYWITVLSATVTNKLVIWGIWLKKPLSHDFLQVDKHRDHLINYIIFLRITPFLPNWFINITSPVINVPLGVFFIGTFLGKTVYPLCGIVFQSLFGYRICNIAGFIKLCWFFVIHTWVTCSDINVPYSFIETCLDHYAKSTWYLASKAG